MPNLGIADGLRSGWHRGGASEGEVLSRSRERAESYGLDPSPSGMGVRKAPAATAMVVTMTPTQVGPWVGGRRRRLAPPPMAGMERVISGCTLGEVAAHSPRGTNRRCLFDAKLDPRVQPGAYDGTVPSMAPLHEAPLRCR